MNSKTHYGTAIPACIANAHDLVDASWGNDISPRFEATTAHGELLTLWVNSPEAEICGIGPVGTCNITIGEDCDPLGQRGDLHPEHALTIVRALVALSYA